MFMSSKALSQSVTALAITPLLVVALAGCSGDAAETDQTSSVQAPATEPASSASPDVDPEPTDAAEPTDDAVQEETCDWDSPRLTAPADVPTGQDGDLQTVIVGSWQHTHTDEG